MHEYDIFLFLWFLFLGSSQLINFSLILQLSKRNHLHSLWNLMEEGQAQLHKKDKSQDMSIQSQTKSL